MPNLDEYQRQVASHRQGAAVCFAVPGAGKTTTAVDLVVGLVADGFAPGEVVSITFTREATATTRARLRAALGPPGDEVVVRTFHSLAKLLVERAQRLMGWTTRAVVDEDRLKALWHEVVLGQASEAVPEALGLSGVDIDELITRIDLHRAQGAIPDRCDDLELHERKAWKAVQEAKNRKGYADFQDLIEAATEALLDPAVGPQLRAGVRAVIIDEVQDLNFAQLQFAKALGGEVVMAVGDPCQAIYGFQGSSPRWCLEFATHWPGATTYHMPRSYRCPTKVLDAARGLLAAMTSDVPRQLVGVREDRGRVHVMQFPDASDEAVWVADQITRVADIHGPEAVCVLARVNRDLEPVAAELTTREIPYNMDTAGFWELPEIVAALDVVRLVVEPTASEAAARLACFPGTGRKAVSEVLRLITLNGGAPYGYQALADRERYAANFRQLIVPSLTFSPDHSPAEFMDWLLGERLEQRMRNKSAERAIQSLQTLAAIARRASSLESLLGIAAARRMQADTKDKRGGVRLMSAHKSKGTEYPYVFILGVEEGRFPHRDNAEFDHQIDEERRLLYVATTRALDTLVYTHTARRDNRDAVPSRFLAEIAERCALLPTESLPLHARAA